LSAGAGAGLALAAEVPVLSTFGFDLLLFFPVGACVGLDLDFERDLFFGYFCAGLSVGAAGSVSFVELTGFVATWQVIESSVRFSSTQNSSRVGRDCCLASFGFEGCAGDCCTWDRYCRVFDMDLVCARLPWGWSGSVTVLVGFAFGGSGFLAFSVSFWDSFLAFLLSLRAWFL
jgi:hypothetical protein